MQHGISRMVKAMKKEAEMFEQISIEFAMKEKEKPVDLLEIPVDLVEIPVTPQENNTPKGAEQVLKSRSQIVQDVMEHDEDSIYSEVSERTQRMVETKISVFFDENPDLNLKFSKKFTAFDKEVIDAVSTLAQISEVMTSASIYRTITGKQEGQYVNPTQRAKVEESMEKCRTCIVTLSLLDGGKGVRYRGLDMKKYRSSAIAFSNIETENKKSENITFYKILEIPILYRLADTLGKISVFPSVLLDTPVAKTESVIAVQSFLLKSIDLMQKNLTEERMILWTDIYQVSGKENTKQYRSKTRDMSKKILQHWVGEGFIQNFLVSGAGKASGVEIYLEPKEKA